MSKTSKRAFRDEDEGRKIKNSLKHSNTDRRKLSDDEVFIEDDSEMSKYKDEMDYFLRKGQ
jgi:hypothetical protein